MSMTVEGVVKGEQNLCVGSFLFSLAHIELKKIKFVHFCIIYNNILLLCAVLASCGQWLTASIMKSARRQVWWLLSLRYILFMSPTHVFIICLRMSCSSLRCIRYPCLCNLGFFSN
ncbi:hypothetical protein ACB092_08G201700 [Castanea dentata]